VKGPGSKLARVLLADLLQGANGPGSEMAWYLGIRQSLAPGQVPPDRWPLQTGASGQPLLAQMSMH